VSSNGGKVFGLSGFKKKLKKFKIFSIIFRAIIKLLPNNDYRGIDLMRISKLMHGLVDYLNDMEMNSSFKEYKKIEHIKDEWHSKGFRNR